MNKRALPFLVAVATATCGPAARQAPRPVDSVPAGDVIAYSTTAVDGQAIFNSLCAQCHTVDPPAATAPPMSHVARYYRAEFETPESATERIAVWVRAPSVDRSILPAHAVERWGLMPALSLNENQATAVAEYVWSLGEERPGSMGAMQGMGMRGSMADRGQTMPDRGMGMMHGRMGSSDSTGHGMGMMHGRMNQDTMAGSGAGIRMMQGRMMQDSAAGPGAGMHGMQGRMGEGMMAGSGMGMMHGRQDSTSAHSGMGMMRGRPMSAGQDTMHQHLMGAGAMCPMHRSMSPDTGYAPLR